MDNIEISKSVIAERLQQLDRAYRKMKGSSYEGFMYELTDTDSKRTFNVDIRLTNHKALIFEVHPGIHVNNMAFLPAMALYCQRTKTAFGSLNISVNQMDIEFHAEDVLKDHPVSIETIYLYEQEAIRVLNLHFDNLLSLSVGRSLSLVPVEEGSPERKRKSREELKFDMDANIQSVGAYLREKSNHNSICEKLNPQTSHNSKLTCQPPDYYSQILTENRSFRMKFYIQKNGVLTITTGYGENGLTIPDAYRYAVSDYINELNAKHMFTSLSIGDDGEGFHCKMSTSLLDGVIGDDTLEFMERISIKALAESIHKVELLAAGIVPRGEKGADEDEIAGIVQKALSSRTGLPDMPKLPSLPPFLSRMIGENKETARSEDNSESTLPMPVEEDQEDSAVSMDEFLASLADDEPAAAEK